MTLRIFIQRSIRVFPFLLCRQRNMIYVVYVKRKKKTILSFIIALDLFTHIDTSPYSFLINIYYARHFNKFSESLTRKLRITRSSSWNYQKNTFVVINIFNRTGSRFVIEFHASWGTKIFPGRFNAHAAHSQMLHRSVISHTVGPLNREPTCFYVTPDVN